MERVVIRRVLGHRVLGLDWAEYSAEYSAFKKTRYRAARGYFPSTERIRKQRRDIAARRIYARGIPFVLGKP